MPILQNYEFCGPTSIAASAVFDAQDSVNLYPERGGPGAASAMALIGTPGLFKVGTLPQAPVRALWAGQGRLFAVAGTHLYEVNNGIGVITDYGAMAGSAGTGLAQIVSNQTQLLVMDSSINNGGGIPGSIFFANSVGPSMDLVFQGGALTYLDGFYVSVASGAGISNQINVSNLGDGSTGAAWPGLNFVVRSGSVDLVTQLEVLNGYLWIFGDKTIEIWKNVGNPKFPFERVDGATLNLGLLSLWSVVKFNNTIMWLGADDHGYAQVYMSNGIQPVKVSTPAIEYQLSKLHPAKLRTTRCWGYQEAGHTFFMLNINNEPSVGVGLTYAYDLQERLWHRRTFNDLAGSGFLLRHRGDSCVSLTGFDTNTEQIYVGDYLTGDIYRMGLQYFNDNVGGANVAIQRQRVGPPLSNKNRIIKVPSFEVFGDCGTAQMVLDMSRDGGKTYPAALARAAISGSTDLSRTGTYKRFKWMQLGSGRDIRPRITITDAANPITLVEALVNVEPGTEP